MFRPKFSGKALLLPWLAVGAGLGSMYALASQDNQGIANQESQRVAQSSQVTEEQIEAFVLARARVQEISNRWQERVKDADSEEKRYTLRQAAQVEMVEAVRDEGLSVNEYNMIVEATQTDPDVRHRVNEMTTEMTGQ